MMAGYLGGGSHVPDSFKALPPEFQQYWGTSQEGTNFNDFQDFFFFMLFYFYIFFFHLTEERCIR